MGNSRRRAQFLRREPMKPSRRSRRQRQPRSRIITAIASGCASASRQAAPDALRRLRTARAAALPARSRAPTPSRSPRRCLPASAPSPRCSARRSPCWRKSKGVGPAVALDLKVIAAAAQRMARGEISGREVLSIVDARCIDYCRAAMAFESARAVPHPLPRQEERADRRRGAADGHGRPHAGLSARGGQARAGTVGHARSSWSTTIRPATRRRRAPTSR